jgi:hypothetical protein
LRSARQKVGRGRDHISAAGSGHDDVALACAGALVRAAKADEGFIPTDIYVADGPIDGQFESRLRGYPMSFAGYPDARDHLTGTLEWERLKNMGKL